MRANFKSCRVRKLIGKLAFLTIADCESEARRIHMIMQHFYRPLPSKATLSESK
jgi:hypothetical protein